MKFPWQKTANSNNNTDARKEIAIKVGAEVSGVVGEKLEKSPNVNNQNPVVKDIVAEVAGLERPAKEKVVETRQIVTFELDKEEYASPITDLKEIIRIPKIVAVPSAPSFIKGIFNLRGQVVVVINLEKRFELRRENHAEPRHIIIVESGNAVFGVVVDEVTGVMRVPITSIKSAPSIITSKIHADYINGVIVLGDSIIETEHENKDEYESDSATQSEANGSSKDSARMLLLLDLPKMLKEQELMEFGSAVLGSINNNKT